MSSARRHRRSARRVALLGLLALLAGATIGVFAVSTDAFGAGQLF